MGQVCKLRGCDRHSGGRGMCSLHYSRTRRGETGRRLHRPAQMRTTGQEFCSTYGCDDKYYALGKCLDHYRVELQRVRYKKLIDKKGDKCNLCRKKYPYCVYDFHHRDPKTKTGLISMMILNDWDRVQREADKCDLLCSNCHRIVTFNSR